MIQAKTIALIDDDSVYSFISQMMIEQSHFADKVLSFNSGLEGIDFLTRNIKKPHALPDLILLDLNMPIMDGWAFLEEFSKMKGKLEKTIIIYIVTSSLDLRDQQRVKETTAVRGFITKPITKEIIENIFADLTPRSERVPEALLNQGFHQIKSDCLIPIFVKK